MDFKIIGKIARDLVRIDRVDYAPSPILTVAHDNDRSFLHQGKHYSPLMDTIEDDLRKLGVGQCQSVARIISTIKGKRSYGKVASPEGGFARALIQKRALGLFKRDGGYPFSSAEKRVWDTILDRTGARKVLAILPSRELCAAAHKRGIWVADVQHGVIAETHPWYGGAFRSSDPQEWIPDAFLCWDQSSANVVDPWALPKNSKAVIVGNRWLVRFAKRAPDDQLVQDIVEQYRKQMDDLAGKPTILVSMSWSVYNIPNGFMVDALAEVIRETADQYNWLLRLHPNQLIGFATDEGERFARYHTRELGGAAIWDWPSHAPLPLLLSCIDMHISWNSSVVIEAAQLGIRSALLDPDLRLPDAKGDYYGDYRARGLIDLVADERPAILDWIGRNAATRGDAEPFDEYDARYAEILRFLTG